MSEEKDNPMRTLPMTHHTSEETERAASLGAEVGCLIVGSTLLGSWLFIELVFSNAVLAFGWPQWAYPLAMATSIAVIGYGGVTLAHSMNAKGVLGRPNPLFEPTCNADASAVGVPRKVHIQQRARRGIPIEVVTLEVYAEDTLLIKQAREVDFVPASHSIDEVFRFTLEAPPTRLRWSVHLSEQVLHYEFTYH